MGQQQLLLLILGMIIVGAAVIFGIDAFGINRIKNNADALVNEGLRIASDVQTWASKPPMYGGMLPTETMADVTFSHIGYASSSGAYVSENGEYSLSTSLNGECDPPVVPSGNTPLVYLNATNAETGNNICIAIAGTMAADIGTDAKYGSGITGL